MGGVRGEIPGRRVLGMLPCDDAVGSGEVADAGEVLPSPMVLISLG